MDIAALSMVMSQSKAQTAAGIAVMKMAMDTGKETGTQMAEMMKNLAVDVDLHFVFSYFFKIILFWLNIDFHNRISFNYNKLTNFCK